jgi:lysophospholipase L1-like esterase
VERLICPTITSDQLIGGQPFAFSDATAGKKRLQIILLGDSTTEASIPKKMAPMNRSSKTPAHPARHRGDLPPCDVYNEGVSGEFIRRLLDTRYDKAVKTKPQADYIFIRYGLNDAAKREGLQNPLPEGLPRAARAPAQRSPEGHAHPDDRHPLRAEQPARGHQRLDQEDRRRMRSSRSSTSRRATSPS